MSNLATKTTPGFRGTLEAGKEQFEYRTSFPAGLRFHCLPGCGLCCKTYRIPLTVSDLSRLKAVVEPEACSAIALEKGRESSGIAGFMENGKGEGCFYLDKDSRCSVYNSRPLYCRTYPLIRDTYAVLEMSVDHTCPGVGGGDIVSTEQIEKAFLLEAEYRPGSLNLRESSANYDIICGSLKARGVYTDVQLMQSVCAELIERGLTSRQGCEISTFFDGVAAALAVLLADTNNILNQEASKRLIEGLENHLFRNPADSVKSFPLAFSEQEEPLRVCLDDGYIPRHLLFYKNRRFFVRDVKTMLSEIDPGSLEGTELSGGAADLLVDYLAEWMSRQALLRFVHTTALAHPYRVNVLLSFFEFLVYVVSRVLITAEVLRKHKRQTILTAQVMREAIRTNDGPLRSRCASVVSRY
jgi:Fe-S-cluster containining protein